MADDVLSQARGAPDGERWPDFFRRQVVANARFWGTQIAAEPRDAPLLHVERDNIVKALNRALQLEAAWTPAMDLLLAFHPYMERRGVMAAWERYVQACLEISRQRGDLAAEAALLDRLGELKRDQGDWAEAVTCHERACQQYGRIGDVAGRSRALISLAQVYRMQRRYPEALQALEEALPNCRECDLQAYAHNSLGLVHFDEYRFEDALASHQRAYDLWSESGNLEGMARAQACIGNCSRLLGDLPQAESSFRSAIALHEQTHSRLHLALASLDLGNLYLEQERAEQAEALYRQAKDVLEEAGYARGLAQVFNNLGMACAQQEKWRLAEDFFGRSIGLWRQLGEPVSQANAEDNLAEAYLAQAKWEAAWEIADRALQRLGAFEPEGRVEALLSDVHEHLRLAGAKLGKEV
jgi:tetratricopeptide (TPR) repeat protein